MSTAQVLDVEAKQPESKIAIHSGRLLLKDNWYAFALLLLAVFWLYFHVVVKLVRDWLEFPDYSHGLLIPFFVVFLIWNERSTLKRALGVPSWAGLSLVAAAMLVLLTGVFGADLFLSRLSLVLLIGGLVWSLSGAREFRAWKFILFVLFLGIPIPAVLLNHITFPLQVFASTISSDVLPLLGVPVLREGNVINLPAMPLEVAEACSGIRSLMSLFTISVIYGYFLEQRVWIRTLLAVASLPIAIIANVARIVGTGLCVQYWDPVKALGFFHEFSGWLLFLVSLTILYIAHRLILLCATKAKA